MQALKLKGSIDESGKLQLLETIDLAPGEVEIIILKSGEPERMDSNDERPPSFDGELTSENIQSFIDWFAAGISPASPDFDTDEAKWESLKEKQQTQ